jgi:alpha-tubulin suppressor-like RCC1 family protein
MLRLSSGLYLAVIGIVALAACEDRSQPTAPGAEGEVVSPATPGTAAASAALNLYQVSGGLNLTCGVTTDSVPHCWGENIYGQLGIGDSLGPEQCQIFGTLSACSTRPIRVAGNHRFGRVSAGSNHACGVTADFQAWCWGLNNSGELGDGTQKDGLVPVRVAGVRFRQVDAGWGYTCGVSYPDSHLYCWGFDNRGRLGIGAPVATSVLKPTPVLSTLTFRQISAGIEHTCAITATTGRAFCWGRNISGELGDSTHVLSRNRPAEVVGKHVFRQIDVSGTHTCAVTTTNKAYCWGNGRSGEIGNGHAYLSFWPRAVSGGLSVRRVTTGGVFTCAETVDNKAYCWGLSNGVLGNGDASGTAVLTPVLVSGSHAFAQINAGYSHTCGKTTLGVGWCWGNDQYGDLGDGNTAETVRPIPVKVLGPS